jgi:hypothetical protein
VRFVESSELSEGEVADNIGVEYEEGVIVFSEDGFSKFERARGAEGLGFDGKGNVDAKSIGILQFKVFSACKAGTGSGNANGTYLRQMFLHYFGAVVDCQDDICDASLCQSFNLVQNHGLVSELDQWLWESEGL